MDQNRSVQRLEFFKNSRNDSDQDKQNPRSGQWIPVIQVQFNMQHTKNKLYCFGLFIVLITGFERKKGPYVQNQSFFQIQHQMKNGKSQKEYEDRQFHQI